MAKGKTVVTVISKISDRLTDGSAALVVIHGVELGRKYDLARKETIIGRSSKVDIQIDQESISRNHARLLADGSQVTLADLGSTNGTYVNDELVSGERPLRNGDLLKIGRTIFKFIAGGNIEAAYHEEIYRLTTVDGLTQVFNRRYFEESLEREVARCHRYGRELALVLLDIDLFKAVNDTHGHLAGDHVLKQIASLVKVKIRREDVLSRYGGEEFAILLPEVGEKGAVVLAEKVRRLVEEHPFEFEGERIPTTVSVGVAALTAGLTEAPDLVRAADEKLYAAKTAGRNCVRS